MEWFMSASWVLAHTQRYCDRHHTSALSNVCDSFCDWSSAVQTQGFFPRKLIVLALISHVTLESPAGVVECCQNDGEDRSVSKNPGQALGCLQSMCVRWSSDQRAKKESKAREYLVEGGTYF